MANQGLLRAVHLKQPTMLQHEASTQSYACQIFSSGSSANVATRFRCG
jgi:hypothetical protein